MLINSINIRALKYENIKEPFRTLSLEFIISVVVKVIIL